MIFGGMQRLYQYLESSIIVFHKTLMLKRYYSSKKLHLKNGNLVFIITFYYCIGLRCFIAHFKGDYMPNREKTENRMVRGFAAWRPVTQIEARRRAAPQAHGS